MNRFGTMTAIGLGLALAMASGPAPAEAGGPNDAGAHGNRGPRAESQTQATPEPGQPAVMQAGTAANEHASDEAKARLEAVIQRARMTPKAESEAVEKGIRSEVTRIDKLAAAQGDQKISARLATEFGMTPDALAAERSRHQVGWGDLVVAHTLQANGGATLTTGDLYAMRSQGLGWGQIAHGLGLELGQVVRAAQAEGRVATGVSKPDGRMVRIEAAGAHSTKSGHAAGSGAGPEHGSMKSGSQSSLGVGQTTPKGHTGK
jgi:hypothetical protein